jgi:hypothetical protein
MTRATFKALIRYEGGMVAGMAAMPGGAARLFIRQAQETEELFVGRISQWIKTQGAEGIEMQEPDVLPEGIEIGEVLLRLTNSLGIKSTGDGETEFDLPNAELRWGEAISARGDN